MDNRPATPSTEHQTGSGATPDRLGYRLGRRSAVMAAVLGTTALAGCARESSPAASDQAASGSGSSSPGDAPSSAPDTSSAPAGPTDQAQPQGPLAGWTLEQKVGQMIMVGVEADAPSSVSSDAVTSHHVGNIFVSGRSQAGSQAVHDVITSLTSLVSPETTQDTPMLVSTDQEGGEIQVLSGAGFSSIPSATDQAGLSSEDLRASALTWGQELAGAGVNMNLAPVADLVDTIDPSSNDPIGRWGRHYGSDAATVSTQATAFAEGMRSAGVIPTYKHFPGLGRVATNTDTAADVTDTVTTRSVEDPAVSVFASAISSGAQVVMMSSAVYSLIDPASPAVFSSAVVTEMLRTELGFTGVVITDDVSAATQLQSWPEGERAVQAVRAGCDLVLASADPAAAASMAQALVEAAQADPGMAARVDESVQRILALKSGQ